MTEILLYGTPDLLLLIDIGIYILSYIYKIYNSVPNISFDILSCIGKIYHEVANVSFNKSVVRNRSSSDLHRLKK